MPSLRHFVAHVTTTAGPANGARVRRWFQEKKAGWYAVLEDSQMPATSTLLDQAHNALERKLFAMKGFHHPGGSQQTFLAGLAHLYNLIPYQRRAQHAGQSEIFADYRLRVAAVLRDYGLQQRDEAPEDSRCAHVHPRVSAP